MNEGEESTSSKAVIVIGGLVIIASTFLPWLRAQGAGQGDIYKGTEIFIVILPVWMAAALMIVSVFIPRPDLRSVLPMIAAGVVGNGLRNRGRGSRDRSGDRPDFPDPEVFREYVVNIGAGAGLWIAVELRRSSSSLGRGTTGRGRCRCCSPRPTRSEARGQGTC